MQHCKLRASQSPGQREASAQPRGTILDAETYVDPRRVKRTGQRDPSYRAFFSRCASGPDAEESALTDEDVD